MSKSVANFRRKAPGPSALNGACEPAESQGNHAWALLSKSCKSTALPRLIDQAIDLHKSGLKQSARATAICHRKKAGANTLRTSIKKGRSTHHRFEISAVDVSLGLARAALEHDAPDSELMRRISDVERYLRKHFVRHEAPPDLAASAKVRTQKSVSCCKGQEVVLRFSNVMAHF